MLTVDCMQQPDAVGADLGNSKATESYAGSPLPPLDSTLVSQRQRQIDNELEYYLVRHNVDDEGFDMVARYAETKGAVIGDYMPRGIITPLSMLRLKTIPRTGKIISRTPQGDIIFGKYEADTLTTGLRLDTEGIYAGQFDRYMQAHGHGIYRSADGAYYEGHFERNTRHGFGFLVNTRSLLAGSWRYGRFLGERMRYTSDRIYGIDISRYQHEQGRKRFNINWRQMTITSLGAKGNQQESAYPVSFVYIKATEGISISNRYFYADYSAAHRQNLHVGAYHFFSTKQSGNMQANFFLSKATLRKGDLPPMLDIEPSDLMIQRMGGIERLFNEIRAWIRIIERHSGTKPLLYVNQNFVRKYLDEAPDLKDNYSIWIARYGEYKPDVHLAIWQLSPNGRVSGINGPVDINVFNGYQGQWDEFIEQETIGSRP